MEAMTNLRIVWIAVSLLATTAVHFSAEDNVDFYSAANLTEEVLVCCRYELHDVACPDYAWLAC